MKMADKTTSPRSESQKERIKRYYIRNEIVPFEEDKYHEFKGHKNLSEDELPPWTVTPDSDRRTRAPVSRTINAFLNSGHGGTIYLGIVDNGKVKGLNLTVLKKDHLIASLDDLMSRYNPRVEKHRYRIRFIPIVEADSTEDDICNTIQFDSGKQADRTKPHLLRTKDYCWCDKDAVAQYNNGKVAPDYVIEIHLPPWNPDDPKNLNAVGVMKTSPIHEDECDMVYFRTAGGIIQYTPQQIYSVSKQRVQLHYMAKLTEMREELEQLREESVKT